jgi:hypothetical protein
MKTNLLKRRYKAQKKSACGLCKPNKRGGEDKKTMRDLRLAGRDEEQIRDFLTSSQPEES